MINQNKLREDIKITKALNDDLYFYHFAEMIGVEKHSFYNFLHGEYELSEQKARQLQNIINDLN